MTTLATVESKLGTDVQESKACMDIKHALPNSTSAERKRFLSSGLGNTSNAIKKLKHYLDWRSKYCKDDDKPVDVDTWEWSCQRAIEVSKDETAPVNTKLPCVLFVHEYAEAGKTKRCAQVLPARVDTGRANATSYALAFAIYLDQTLDRNSYEKLTLSVDVRAGRGWANINAFKLIPFIQGVTKLLTELHPERLDTCIIFPVPGIAVGIWRAVKPFLDKETSGRVHIVSGPAGLDDGLPKKVEELFCEDLIQKTDKSRLDCQSN